MRWESVEEKEVKRRRKREEDRKERVEKVEQFTLLESKKTVNYKMLLFCKFFS